MQNFQIVFLSRFPTNISYAVLVIPMIFRYPNHQFFSRFIEPTDVWLSVLSEDLLTQTLFRFSLSSS